jgi:hypothetical protein
MRAEPGVSHGWVPPPQARPPLSVG